MTTTTTDDTETIRPDTAESRIIGAHLHFAGPPTVELKAGYLHLRADRGYTVISATRDELLRLAAQIADAAGQLR